MGLSELALPWQAAVAEAWAALLAGSIPIGAVVAGADGTILSRGHNHIEPHAHAPVNGHGLAHAELNALLQISGRSAAELHPCALYTTMEPCPLCLGAWYMSGVRSLHYAARDPWAGSTNILGATWYLSHKPVRVCGPPAARLEILLTGLHTAHFLLRPDGPSHPLLDRWHAVVPLGIEFGRWLHLVGRVCQLRADQTPLVAGWAGLETDLDRFLEANADAI